MQLFGFEFKRKDLEDTGNSFVPKENDDGAVVVAAGGSFGTYVDLDGSVRTEAELVTRYRDMAMQAECDAAIDEVVNEAIVEEAQSVVDINVDDLQIPDKVKKAIREEFKHVLNLLDFNRYAYEIFRRWYVDGRLYYHVVIDDKNPQDGIQEVRFIDPRKIRKVREIIKKRPVNGAGGSMDATLTKVVNEYYLFSDKGFATTAKTQGVAPTTTGLRIAKDAIVQVNSGISDNTGQMVLSYLHKSIKPLNQLRTLEDALVIYRLARAPERRIWYVDVGNLPKMKAEQYVRDLMAKHKNRLVYDAESGNVRDDRKFMTMLEDYWLPRREGGRGTEVTTLPGGQNLGQMEDVLYFQKKFLQSLNVPVNRLNSDALFSMGRATEVTRDELKFARFIERLRMRFAMLFNKMLERQLILKQIVSVEDWKVFEADIKFDFAKDNYFSELKNAEIFSGRIELMHSAQDLLGKFYSYEWARKNILQQSDDDIEENDLQIEAELNSGDSRWAPTEPDSMFGAERDDDQLHVDGGGGGSPPEESDDKSAKLLQAKADYELIKRKPENNRTAADRKKFRSATQVLAKNK